MTEYHSLSTQDSNSFDTSNSLNGTDYTRIECIIQKEEAPQTCQFFINKPPKDVTLRDLKLNYFSLGHPIGVFFVKTYENAENIETNDFQMSQVEDFATKTIEPDSEDQHNVQGCVDVFRDQDQPVESLSYHWTVLTEDEEPILFAENGTVSNFIVVKVMPIPPRSTTRYIKKGEPGYKRPKYTYVKKGEVGYKRPKYNYVKKTTPHGNRGKKRKLDTPTSPNAVPGLTAKETTNSNSETMSQTYTTQPLHVPCLP